MTGLEKSVEILKAIMNESCNFLTLTMESCSDFNDNKLPTLDLNICVTAENITLWQFYSKPMACNHVIQKESAMPENIKITTLNQEVIRRRINTSELVRKDIRLGIIDDFAQQIVNSGYPVQQTRIILVGGLKGYKRKLALSKDRSNPRRKPLCPCSEFNAKARAKKKILAKSNWFKRGHQEEDTLHPEGSPTKKQKRDKIFKDDILLSIHQEGSEEEHLVSAHEEGSDGGFQVSSHLEEDLLESNHQEGFRRRVSGFQP